MTDTAQSGAVKANADSRQIRLFLSSTFRDFMEERDLLVKQVFPELRRKARERGVEVVDVDLRWGITEEESRQGKVIPICLGEIDRCRPYFVGMLGERYGWIPPADQYSSDVIERQPWLKGHLGGVSVTELEILHGVLNDPAMAGHAFFYFRDPAWSVSQGEPGFVCETDEEEAKLADLKQRIRTSGFPVAKNIPDPKALAEQIGRDLWELIEQQHPDLDEPDALEREEHQHASYRRSRLGVYLGGQRSINQLERWIDAGQQKILITGESGAGKSALIANWIAAHQQNQPQDVVFAHHLGCSSDASAIRPLLARLIETAKRQLPEVYGNSLAVPQDWWELVAKAVEALQSLGRWAMQNNHRWIWVIDGLDRLASDDQNALPWLPLSIPDGVVIVASALECPAKEILLQSKFKTHTIAALRPREQDALIKQYLDRYTKQLIAELRQAILSHPLAGSPLFLRVLLEELRQCGRYETLAEQLAGYLRAETIDDLYERVLERLEADGNADNVRKVMTALWASRAGLSEEELLLSTRLKPLQWAPIDLALEEALGRNSNRLVLDHEYLRKAVQDRYLPTEAEQRQAHSQLADWFEAKDEWDERDSEELPWQLLQSSRHEDLRQILLSPWLLAKLSEDRGAREVASLWMMAKEGNEIEIDELIAERVTQAISDSTSEPDACIWLIDHIADVLEESGLHRELLLRLRITSCEMEESAPKSRSRKSFASSLQWLGDINREMGLYDKAEEAYRRCLAIRESMLGGEHPDTRSTLNCLAKTLQDKGDQGQAEAYFRSNLEVSTRLLGVDHPDTLADMNNLGLLLVEQGNLDDAEKLYRYGLSAKGRTIGKEDPDTLITISNLGALLAEKGDHEEAEKLLIGCLEIQRRLMGNGHPNTLCTLHNLGVLFQHKGDYTRAASMLQNCIEQTGADHPDTAISMKILGEIYEQMEDHEHAEACYQSCFQIRDRVLGSMHPETNNAAFLLADFLSGQERFSEAINLRRRELEWSRLRNGNSHSETLTSILSLAIDLGMADEYAEAEELFREIINNYTLAFVPGDTRAGHALHGLAKTLYLTGKYNESAIIGQKALDFWLDHEGASCWEAKVERRNLAKTFYKLGQRKEARVQLEELIKNINPDDESGDDRQLASDAEKLMRQLKDTPPEES